MNIYWLNPPISTRSIHCDLAWMNFNTVLPKHNWITPIIDWDLFKTVDDIIDDIEKQPIDVFMISNYAWNHKLCSEVARKIRNKHPNVIIISGGPNQFDVPDYIDYMCFAMGHGEIFLIELFKQLEKHGKVIAPDFVPYLITKNFKSLITTSRYEFPAVSSIKHNHEYILENVNTAKRLNKTLTFYYETTRGCPYSCTYCEWGAGGTSAKLSQKPLDIILEEIELLALSGVTEISIIDANFGILKRDVDIIKKIAECKKLYGNPQLVMLFGLTKNSRKNKEAVLDVMFEAELMEVYFMAIQSADENVLNNVKRTDIDLEDNMQLAEKYKRLYNSSAKVELIMGLPGDTLDNFYKEMDLVQRLGSWFYVRNTLCLLPNTEAHSEEYREKYKIKTVLVGSSENEEQDITYFSDSVINQFKSSFEMVVETLSYTKEEYKEMFFINRAQRVIGPMLKGPASIELRKWFNAIKNEEWYKPIDEHLTKLVNGELSTVEITTINNKSIEEIISENVKTLAN